MHSPSWGSAPTAITQQPFPATQGMCALITPRLRQTEVFRQPRTGCGYPGVAAPKKPGHQGEPQGIDAVRGQQVRSETGATEQHQPMNTSGSQSFQSLGPRFTKGDPTFKSNLHWSRRQQPALQGLPEKKPVLMEVRRSAHHNSSRLLRSPLAAALVKQLMVT